MSQINITAENDLWYLTSPDLHYGKLEKGGCLSSGQEAVETYETEAEWLDALSEHDIDPNQEEEQA